MAADVNRHIKYPLYSADLTWFERLMVRIGVGVVARCTVCGSFAPIRVREANLRETCVCVRCRSTNRHRQIAYVACQSVKRTNGQKLSSLKEFAELDKHVVYNTEASGPLHNHLSGMTKYICSEYLGDSYKSGDMLENIMHQDLMDLSLDDESIDMVISSDVFEHIPRPYRAHEEVYRVLKREGRHIFTAPFHQADFIDDERATVDSNGKTLLLKEPIYHYDPLRSKGILVYTIFAIEMLVKLRIIGFRTNLYHLHRPLNGIFGPNALVFEAIKDRAYTLSCTDE